MRFSCRCRCGNPTFSRVGAVSVVHNLLHHHHAGSVASVRRILAQRVSSGCNIEKAVPRVGCNGADIVVDADGNWHRRWWGWRRPPPRPCQQDGGGKHQKTKNRNNNHHDRAHSARHNNRSDRGGAVNRTRRGACSRRCPRRTRPFVLLTVVGVAHGEVK